MIKAIRVTNHQGESLRMELDNPWETGLAVRGVTGLGPVKATVNMTDLATSDGGVYNSARAQKRNIVAHLLYLDVPTVEAVRRKSYKYFPLKQKVRLEIETDDKTLYTEGYVESNEALVFSDRTGASISLLCPSSYLRDVETKEITISGVTPAFEFPFEGTATPNLIFGNIKAGEGINAYYSGDADNGLTFTIRALGTVTNLMIYKMNTQEYIEIDTTKLTAITGDPIIDGDVITIDTRMGHKAILLFRDGVETNILNAMSEGSIWLSLEKGDNVIAYTADTGENLIGVELKYEELFEGV